MFILNLNRYFAKKLTKD